jgi:hypothetical protein
MRRVSSCRCACMAQQARQRRRLGLLQGVGHGRIGQTLKARRLGVFENQAAWCVKLGGGRCPIGRRPMAQTMPPSHLLREQHEQGQEGVRQPTPQRALSGAPCLACGLVMCGGHVDMLPVSHDSFSASPLGPWRARGLCLPGTWLDFAERLPPALQSAGAVRWIDLYCPPRRFSGHGGSDRLA